MNNPSKHRASLHDGGSEVCAGTTAAPVVAKPMSKSTAELEAKLKALTVKKGGALSAGPVIRMKPGSRLVREWRGKTHDVLVLEDGFEWNGERRRSLSAIAREITGTHWSGPRFFGLKPRPMPFGGEERADG